MSVPDNVELDTSEAPAPALTTTPVPAPAPVAKKRGRPVGTKSKVTAGIKLGRPVGKSNNTKVNKSVKIRKQYKVNYRGDEFIAINLAEIAKVTGASLATVSNIVNGCHTSKKYRDVTITYC